jgi:hypothetical protein
MDRRRGAAYEPAFYSDVIARLAVNPSIRLRSADANPTLLREAEQHVGSKYVDQVLDSLYVLESSMGHFFIRAEMGKNAGRKQSEVDADYEKAAHLGRRVRRLLATANSRRASSGLITCGIFCGSRR